MFQISATTPSDLHRSYVQALLERLNANREDWYHGSGEKLPVFLQNYATLGIHAQRQSGGKFWMMCEFTKNPESIMLVPSEDVARSLIEAHTTGTNPNTPVFLPQLQPGQAERIYSINQYMNGSSDGTIIPGGDFTFIMDAGRVFSRVRVAKFYQWLSTHVDWKHTVLRLN